MSYMVVSLVMSDVDTGEVLWNCNRGFACNFVNNDAGRILISKMIDSAIKGVRSSDHKRINCSVTLQEPVQKELPFDIPIQRDKDF